MDPIHTAEIAVTLFLQSLGSWLAAPMKLISFLGQEEFYLLLMPILYWCVDATLGLRVGVMLLLAQFTNCFFKVALHGGRPYWFDPRVHAFATESSFGIPSGHAESATGIFGLMAISSGKRWAVISTVVLILLVGLSRLYLGVHFLSDVLLGWLIGGLLLALFIKLEPGVTAWIGWMKIGQQIGMVALSTLGMILVSWLSLAFSAGFVIPAIWVQNASAAAPGVAIDPFNLDWIFTISGTWFGMLAGAAWLWQTHGKFNASGPALHRLLRYLIGAAGLFLLWYGLGAVFPRTADWYSFVLRFLRYTLIGLWVTALAPLLFTRLRISDFIPGSEIALHYSENHI